MFQVGKIYKVMLNPGMTERTAKVSATIKLVKDCGNYRVFEKQNSEGKKLYNETFFYQDIRGAKELT